MKCRTCGIEMGNVALNICSENCWMAVLDPNFNKYVEKLRELADYLDQNNKPARINKDKVKMGGAIPSTR